MTISQPQSVCRDCRQSIAAGARKCVHCGSFQGPRRWFGLAATALSVAIATLTLGGLVGPQVQFLLSPRTGVNVVTVASTGDAYVVLVENRGRRAVVLNQALVFWPDDPRLPSIGFANLDIRAPDGADITLIEGRSSVVVPLYYPATQERPLAAGESFFYSDYPPVESSDCTLDIEFAHADGVFSKQISEVYAPDGEVPAQCNPEFWNFLQGIKPVG